jgi:hypothetical protein
MKRRRSEGGDEGGQAEETDTPTSSGPQLRVQMTGTAEEVKKQLGVGPEKAETKPEPVLEDFEKFSNLLKNPKYMVRVKRLRPKQWKGQKTAVEVWTSELPLQWEEIKAEVTEIAKGGTYKVSVVNPETGGMVDARNFEIDGDPLIEKIELSDAEKLMFAPQEKDATEEGIQKLEQRARFNTKLLEVEEIESALREARERRDGKGKKSTNEDDARIVDLDRRLTEAKHQAELEARDRKHAEEMRELKALIAANNKPAQQGPSEVTLLIQQMQKNQESADKRFESLQKQLQDDRMNQLVQKIDNLEKRPNKESGGFLDFAESAIKMKKLFGWGAGADDDDEEEDDPNDDRPWWQKALDRLGDKLTPRVIDKIFDRLDGLETSGKKVDKDDFTKSLEIEMKKAEDEAVRIATERAIKALPQSKEPPPPKKEVVPQVNVMERKVVGEPEAPRPAAPLPTEEKATEVTVEDPKSPLHLVKDPPAAVAPTEAMPIAKEICLRVCNVILILERELETRPRQFNWNYEGAWNMLPEAVLEKVCLSKTPAEVFDAFKVEGINVEDLDKMKEKVISAPRAAAWMSRGISELNRWWKKVEADPDFDPADEGEGEEAEEEGGGL